MLALAVAKMLDPMLFATALVLGMAVGRWWLAVLVGALVATACQLILRDPSTESFAAASVAYVIPASLGYATRRSVARGSTAAVLCLAATAVLSGGGLLAFLNATEPVAGLASGVTSTTTATVADPLEALYAAGAVVRPQPTVQQVEARQIDLRAASPHSMIDDIALAIGAGNNVAANLRADFDRSIEAGEPDANFDNEGWLEAHEQQIPQTERWRFMLTKNATDSTLLLQQLRQQHADRILLAARGFS